MPFSPRETSYSYVVKIWLQFLPCSLKLSSANLTGPRSAGASYDYLHLKTRCREEHAGDVAVSAYCAVREADMEQCCCLLLDSSGADLDYSGSVEQGMNHRQILKVC